LRPIHDSLDLSWLHFHAVGADDVSQEIDLCPKEFALACLGVQLVVLQGLQHFFQVLFMLLHRLAEDEDIIKVHDDEVVQKGPQNPVHEVLEGGGRVGETEGHLPDTRNSES